MNKLILSALLLTFCRATAQTQIPTEGITYFLPETALRSALLIEKTTFTSSEYTRYSERFVETSVSDQPTTTYRIVVTQMDTYVMLDSTKQLTTTVDEEHSIVSVSRDQDGVIMVVNDKPRAMESQPALRPARKLSPIGPIKCMTAEMLAADSSARTAELAAQDIYDIRDNKNQLSHGEAGFMPEDDEQPKIVLNNLNMQKKTML